MFKFVANACSGNKGKMFWDVCRFTFLKGLLCHLFALNSYAVESWN